MMKTLHKINHGGTHLLWSIERVNTSTVRMIWGQKGGAMQTKYDRIETNWSGRTIDEQVELEIQSRINSQLDKGYRYTVEEAQLDQGKNLLNLPRPMLAKPYNGEDLYAHFIQYKYNGHRCMIHNNGDELIAYSRNGKVIHTVNHILEQIDIPVGATLDGELYIHGESLQSISSLVRRVQPDNHKLTYMVFDHVCDKPFADRFDNLCKWISPNETLYIADTVPVTSDRGYYSSMGIVEAINLGYEGLIARNDKIGYEAGKRSKQLLKLKKRFDCEATVISISPSKDGWAILNCIWQGNTFSVTAPGSMEDKYEVLLNSQNYVGKMVTVEFAELTEDGTPFHPVAIGFRREE